MSDQIYQSQIGFEGIQPDLGIRPGIGPDVLVVEEAESTLGAEYQGIQAAQDQVLVSDRPAPLEDEPFYDQTNFAWASNHGQLMEVREYIQPNDDAVMDLVDQLFIDGTLRDDMTDEDKVAAITQYLQQNISYERDEQNEGWSTVSESIAKGSGDCEDFATLGMSMALAADVDPSKLNIYVHIDQASGTGHVFLGLQSNDGSVRKYDATTGEIGAKTVDEQGCAFKFNEAEFKSLNGMPEGVFILDDPNHIEGVFTAGDTSTMVTVNTTGDDPASFIEPDDPLIFQAVNDLKSLGRLTDDMTDEEKLKIIGEYVEEKIAYEADSAVEGWKKVGEALTFGNGDCEERAIVMMSMAIAAGIDESKLQAYVTSNSANIGHVFLGFSRDDGSIARFDPTSGSYGESTVDESLCVLKFNREGVTRFDDQTGDLTLDNDTAPNTIRTAGQYASIDYVNRVDGSRMLKIWVHIAEHINDLYKQMKQKAGEFALLEQPNMDENGDGVISEEEQSAGEQKSYDQAGELFLLQQELQDIKDQISLFTSMGSMMRQIVGDHRQAMARHVERF